MQSHVNGAKIMKNYIFDSLLSQKMNSSSNKDMKGSNKVLMLCCCLGHQRVPPDRIWTKSLTMHVTSLQASCMGVMKLLPKYLLSYKMSLLNYLSDLHSPVYCCCISKCKLVNCTKVIVLATFPLGTETLDLNHMNSLKTLFYKRGWSTFTFLYYTGTSI